MKAEIRKVVTKEVVVIMTEGEKDTLLWALVDKFPWSVNPIAELIHVLQDTKPKDKQDDKQDEKPQQPIDKRKVRDCYYRLSDGICDHPRSCPFRGPDRICLVKIVARECIDRT